MVVRFKSEKHLTVVKVVVSSEENLVPPILENIKFVNYEDTAFLAWEDRVIFQVIVTVVLNKVCDKIFCRYRPVLVRHFIERS